MQFVPLTVVSIEEIDADDCYDIWNMEDDCLGGEGNFLVEGGVVVHNCIPDYVKRRDDVNGKWRDHEDASIAEILADTSGILVYQEQLAAMWQVIAGFTAVKAQESRKAVAKKWIEKLEGIGKEWVAGATPRLGKEKAEEWWGKMVTFGRYAFNKCMSGDSVIVDVDGRHCTVADIYHNQLRPQLWSYDGVGLMPNQCVDAHYCGELEVFEIEFDNGQVERVTADHKFLCADGAMHTVQEIQSRGLDVVDVGSGRPTHPTN